MAVGGARCRVGICTVFPGLVWLLSAAGASCTHNFVAGIAFANKVAEHISSIAGPIEALAAVQCRLF